MSIFREGSVSVMYMVMELPVAEALIVNEPTFSAVKVAALAPWERESESAIKRRAGAKILNMRLFIRVPVNYRLYYINPD